MSNVVTMDRTQDYWVQRACRHRMAGRYDEAMALLSRVRAQSGAQEALDWEMALTYEAMGCEDEAARAYLRVVRAGGEHKGMALFQLTLLHANRADARRAASFFVQYRTCPSPEIPMPKALAVGHQLAQMLQREPIFTRTARAMQWERHAVEQLQAGRRIAARRALNRALALGETPQRLTLLACCDLLDGEYASAVTHASQAHRMAPGRMQPQLVLTDALYAQGDAKAGRRMLYLAALRAKSPQAMQSVALESAKHGEDVLTLRLTRRLLRREPFCTQGMMLRACALLNMGRLQDASRLLGRLCGLLPEDTVSRTLYQMARDGVAPLERMTYGADVPKQQALERAMRLIAALYEAQSDDPPGAEDADALCALSAWAFRSAYAGPHTAIIALMLMSAMNTPKAREVLLDALVDPQIDDSFKCAILQALTARDGFQDYDVDMGGRFVRLAAGGAAQTGGERCQQVVQQAADALLPDFPTAPQTLLPLYIAYLNTYGAPRCAKRRGHVSRQAAALSAALQAAFHALAGRSMDCAVIARASGASPRMTRMLLRRLLHLSAKQSNAQTHPM